MRTFLLSTVAALAAVACVTPADEPPELAATTQALDATAGLVVDVQRERLAGDIYHHRFTLVLGDAPNARIRLHRVVRERAPWIARPTRSAAMLLHGDFSSFDTNFVRLAPWLAARDLDVWGVDRRWAVAEADADLSDFGDMGFAQEIDDTRVALAAARAVRAITGGGLARMHLVGFSRGGFLAYAVAADDAARSPLARHVKGLVPLDVWAELPPEDEAARAWICDNAALERQRVADGVTDAENGFFIALGELALAAPDEPSPLFEGYTNREAFLITATQTFLFFAPTETYHLAAGTPAGLSASPEDDIATWFAHATPHQSMREAADTDGIWCGDGQGPFTVDLARIRVPLLYVGATGGYGTHGVYSTTRVSSTDVTTVIVDGYGHGDLLFGDDAANQAWTPLANWLVAH